MCSSDLLTALVLGLSSGVALADRHDHRGGDSRGGDHRGGDNRGGDRRAVVEHRGSPQVIRDHRSNGDWNRGDWNRGNWNRGTVVRGDNWRGGSRVVIRNGRSYPYYHNVVRRPIYVSRPIIRHRYFDYYQRPAIIFESYGPRAGYYWVAGQWSWNGYEWIWQPGHYEPDPSYIDSYYDNGYDNSY